MSDETPAIRSAVQQNALVNRPADNSAANEAVHFLDYWQILYSRKEIVIAVALIMIFTGIVVTRAMPKVYQATTLIQVQREHSDINVYGQSRIGYDPYFLRTQFEIIHTMITPRVAKMCHSAGTYPRKPAVNMPYLSATSAIGRRLIYPRRFLSLFRRTLESIVMHPLHLLKLSSSSGSRSSSLLSVSSTTRVNTITVMEFAG